MKKFFIVLSNILLLFLVFAFFEFYFFSEEKKRFDNKDVKYSLVKEDFNMDSFLQNSKIRKPLGLEYNKRPVLIYGCSFAYGFKLQEEETLGYNISQKCKRPVYNFGASAKGLQHAYYLIKNSKIIEPEPEYIFYIFINDHFRRMFINCQKIDRVKYLTYENIDGELVQKNNKFELINRFCVLSNINDFLYENIYKKINANETEALAELYFKSINNEIKLKYPNAKFVIVDYETSNYYLLNKRIINRLKKQNIDYININEELNHKLGLDSYKLSKETDSFRHPNAKAWNEVSDFLIQKYNL